MFKQKLVYVCSPVKGNVEVNIAKAKGYCRSVLIAGHIPLAPHVALSGVLDDRIQQERETALSLGLELLKRCDELWRFGDIVSEGMKGEIELAKELGIPVKAVIYDSGIYKSEAADRVTHEVKILPEYYADIESGAKKFEYRKDDRGYRVGDIIKLREYLPKEDSYTGNSLEAEITYILKGRMNIPTGYAIMSINKL